MNKQFYHVVFFIFTLCLANVTQANTDGEWRVLTPENTILMDLPHGQVVIALAPEFAPNHVARFKSLVRKGFYDGMPFNRVIDGFVAQAGPEQVSKDAPPLALEASWKIDNNWTYTFAQAPDMFAPQTGFKNGFAIGVDSINQDAWLLHCPGVIGLGRNNQPDTASSHFYITIGQAPRYLDRIMSLFGRIIYGMEHIQGIARTQGIKGQEAPAADTQTAIVSMQVMADVAAEKQLSLAIPNTQHQSFKDMLEQRRHRQHPFFYKAPPPVLDVCQVPLGSKLLK